MCLMLVDWYTESLRLTFFVDSKWNQRALLSEISDATPQESRVLPPIQAMQEIGALPSSKLNVMQRPGRIDILLGGSKSNNIVDPAEPNYKPFF